MATENNENISKKENALENDKAAPKTNAKKEKIKQEVEENKKVVFLATGGTGGHIIPAITIAKKLKKENIRPIVVADEKYKKFKDLAGDIEFQIIQASSIKKSPKALLVSLFTIFKGFLRGLFLISKYKPSLVIGFGGYASFPILRAAKFKNVKIALHEQNSYMGKVNKVLSKSAAFIATSYPETYGVRYEAMQNVEFTGNPVRESIKDLYDEKFIAPKFDKDEKMNILIVGGSGGARFMSKVISEALLELPRLYKDKIFVTQQCREEDIDMVSKKYNGSKIESECKTFFLDMKDKIKKAHLVIARSGASTISEMTVAGKPMILIPYPYSANNHQLKNAQYVEKRKGGIIMEEKDFQEKEFLDLVKEFIDKPNKLLRMSKLSKESGIVDADEKIVELIKREID